MKTSTFNNVMLSGVGCVCVAYLALVAFASADSETNGAAFLHRHAYQARMQGPIVSAVRQLNLSTEQRQRIRLLIDQTKQQAVADMKSNRPNLSILADPSDSRYSEAVLIAKANAANRVQRRSDLFVQIYAILTPEQQAKLPAVLTNAEAKMQRRFEKRLQRDAPAATG